MKLFVQFEENEVSVDEFLMAKAVYDLCNDFHVDVNAVCDMIHAKELCEYRKSLNGEIYSKDDLANTYTHDDDLK